jgi:hypothetical protein
MIKKHDFSEYTRSKVHIIAKKIITLAPAKVSEKGVVEIFAF